MSNKAYTIQKMNNGMQNSNHFLYQKHDDTVHMFSKFHTFFKVNVMLKGKDSYRKFTLEGPSIKIWHLVLHR